jgi:RNA polymerase sigma-70 factor (ECF subfamily)
MADTPQEFQALLQRLREGDPAAAQALLDRYGPLVLSVVRRMLHRKMRSKYDSQDFVQDVWASFFTRPAGEQPEPQPAAFAAFLARMARNKVIDAYRKGARRPRPGAARRERSLDGSAAFVRDEKTAASPTASQEAVARDELERLKRGHPEHCQRILSLLALGHTNLEIADRLGVNEKTVRRLIRRLQRRQRE